MLFVFLSCKRVFFTLGTLFGFIGLFDSLNVFSEFGLKGFLKELSSFDEEELVHVVEGLPVGGVIGDEIALGE